MEVSGYMASWRQDAVAPGVSKAFHRHIESWQRTKQTTKCEATNRSIFELGFFGTFVVFHILGLVPLVSEV